MSATPDQFRINAEMAGLRFENATVLECWVDDLIAFAALVEEQTIQRCVDVAANLPTVKLPGPAGSTIEFRPGCDFAAVELSGMPRLYAYPSPTQEGT